MELSIPRPRFRWPVAGSARHDLGSEPARPGWAAARGITAWSATADIAGAFPGFGQRGGLLIGAKVRLTERYLLADEGRAHGFGLSLTAVRQLAVGTAGEAATRRKAVLQVSYDDGRTERSFVIRPRAVRFGWSRDRGGDVLAAWRGAGHEPALAAETPSLLVSWEEARRFRDEYVIWSGRATAPRDPLGLSRAAGDVWLTTRSLMWSGDAGPGLNRIPHDQIVDALPVELLDYAHNPGLVIGYLDGQGQRRDLVLICDRHLSAERNERERAAMVAGFRSRGIGLGSEAAVDQPWRRDWWPAAATPERGVDRDLTQPLPPPSTPVSWHPAPDLVLTRAYEAEALRLLATANARARDPRRAGDDPVLQGSLGDALAEIETAEAGGALAPASAAFRRARLLALSDAGPRLGALVRLCRSGQLSPERLEARRLAILEPLNRFVVEPETTTGVPEHAA